MLLGEIIYLWSSSNPGLFYPCSLLLENQFHSVECPASIFSILNNKFYRHYCNFSEFNCIIFFIDLLPRCSMICMRKYWLLLQEATVLCLAFNSLRLKFQHLRKFFCRKLIIHHILQMEVELISTESFCLLFLSYRLQYVTDR